MKAVVYTKYGSPDVLQLKEVEKPIPKDDDVLIKVHAASINSWDWDMLTGRPLEYRLLSGILKPTKSKESTGRAGGFEGFANPKGSAPIGGFTNQSPFALPDAL